MWRSTAVFGSLVVALSACGGSKSNTATSAIAPYQSDATRPTTPTERTIPVPEGAPPLPLYSGDPVAMTRADMKYVCWWNQHPEFAPINGALDLEPGTVFFQSDGAEARRVHRNGLVQETCTEVVDVVASPEADPTRVAAVMTTRLRPTVEISSDGTRSPLAEHWDQKKTLVRWHEQPDGRWLVDDLRVVG